MAEPLVVTMLLLSVLVAGFAAMARAAIGRISRVKAHQLAEQRRQGADLLLEIVEDPRPFVGALLLATVLAHVGGTALAVTAAARSFGGAGAVATAVVVAFLAFAFAELGPKALAFRSVERSALALAAPSYFVGALLRPFVRLFDAMANSAVSLRRRPQNGGATDEEPARPADDAPGEEEIEEEERELIESVFEFGDTVVREVMVPRTDMVAIEVATSLTDALDVIIRAGYSRIPTYEGDTDNIVGVLYAKDLLKRIHERKGDTNVATLARAPLFVPEQKKVAELLREMQQQRVHMAIVVDEYGGTAGLVTIEDLVEEIVGEIVDEYDQEEPLVEPIDDDTIRVDAKMPIDEVNELLGVELPHDEWDTVGGLVFDLTGRVPVPGETVDYDSLEFRTERVTGRRIQKVVIRKLQTESGSSQE